MRCTHRRAGQLVTDWLAGVIVAADYRMTAVRFNTDVFATTGQPVPERTLWCTHGSPNLRRRAERDEPSLSAEVTSHEH